VKAQHVAPLVAMAAASGFFGYAAPSASAYAETLADSLGLNKLASGWSAALSTAAPVRRSASVRRCCHALRFACALAGAPRCLQHLALARGG
jgi:hypothetical protein